MIDTYWVSSIVMQCLLVVLVLAMLAKLGQEIRRDDNDIEWWQLIATHEADGKNYASPTKLWLNIGAVIVTWVIVFIVLQVDWRARGVEVIGALGMYLLFISGVEAYAKHLRSKQGDKDVSTSKLP